MVLLPGSRGLAQKRGARPGWEEGLAHTSQLLGSQECRWENNRQWPGDGDRGHCRPPFPRPAVYRAWRGHARVQSARGWVRQGARA